MRQFVYDHEQVGPWVCERIDAVYSPTGTAAIGLEEDGVLIAGVLYDTYLVASIAMHVAAEPNKKWATKENLKVWFQYPFAQLKVHKVIAPVKETNKQAQRFNEHLGFVLETRVKDACIGGDLLIYSMTREQCSFLGD